ncbi:acetyltransferase [Sphaerisporangium rufum]|uniref:Acetyltransferase n=1 Tax=Sphaerisporangium rufum TaxID=1381558 RepID=A0A919RAV4_9ACTN|nr:GNAT family N-acetyltransferase [Sphaerisporangium rufum]GII81601.1 acetyltransferase [Sphaerisporangium rufum]
MTVTLRTEAGPDAPALVLRPWTGADVAALIEVYRDPVLRRFTRVPVTGEAEARRWIAAQHEGWAGGHRRSFATWEGDRLVANVVLKNVDPGGGSAEVGYWTAAEARGRGVAPRALDALCRWAFGGLGLRRLDLRHQVDNPASCRVAGKCGFPLVEVVPASPPFPLDGHLHVRWRAESESAGDRSF